MASKRKIKKGKKEKKPKLKQKQKQSQNVNIVIDQSKRSVRKSAPSQPQQQQFPRYLMPSANPNITVNIPDYLTRRNSLENYVVEPKKTFEKVGVDIPQMPEQNEFRNKRPNSILKERGFAVMSPITPFTEVNNEEEEQNVDDSEAGIETVPSDLEETEENVEEDIEIKEAIKWIRSVKEDIQNYRAISPAQARKYVKVLKDNGILTKVELKDMRLTLELNKPPDLKEAEEEAEANLAREANEWLKNVLDNIENYGKPSLTKAKKYGIYLKKRELIKETDLKELREKWNENKPKQKPRVRAGKSPKAVTAKRTSMKNVT